MRITDVVTLPLTWKCEPIHDALSTSTLRKALIIRVSTDAGITGTGEAFLYGCSLKGAQAILEEHLKGTIIGEDPLDIPRLYGKMLWSTMAFGRRGVVLGLISGIDIALWDILGQAEGKPISRLLDMDFHLDRIPSYASGGFYATGKGLDGLKKEAEDYVRKGYSFMKMKVGRNLERNDSPLNLIARQENAVTVNEDIDRIEAVLSVFGSGHVMIDSNAAYSVETIRELAPVWEQEKLLWIEEPLRFEDVDGLKETANLLPTVAIAGFETEQVYGNFEHLLQAGCLEVPQVDIGWAGGFTGCMAIAKLSKRYGKKLSLHSFGSAVHFAASLQLAAALDNTEMIESEENRNLLRSGIAAEPFEADGAMSFYVPEKSGIGIELDFDKLSRFISN